MGQADEAARKKADLRAMRERCAAMGGRIAESAQVNSAIRFSGPIDIADGAVVYAPAEIGAFTYLNVGSVVFPQVTIGKFCSIGRNVQIGLAKHPVHFVSTHPFQFSKNLFARVPGYAELQREKWQFHTATHIEHDVWIGAGALISGGVRIGTGAVIGGGAVVTRDVAPYEVVGGVPARRISMRFEADVVDRLLKSEWWDLPLSKLRDVDFGNVENALACLEALATAGEGA